METCFNYCNPDEAFFSSDERRWINRIHKLAQEHPDDVRIIREPEQNGGCIYAKIPVKWLKVAPPVKRVLTDEQKKALADRMRSVRRVSSETQ